MLDAATVTALRTAAQLAADVSRARTRAPWAVVGCGVNGTEAARMSRSAGARPVWDVDEARRHAAADEVGAEVADSAPQTS